MHKLNVHLKKGALCGVLALALGSLVVGNVAAIVAPTPAYAASKKSSKKSKKTKDGSVKGVKVKKKVDKYTWSELAKISDAMTKSGSRKAALKIAKKYKLCDKKASSTVVRPRKLRSMIVRAAPRLLASTTMIFPMALERQALLGSLPMVCIWAIRSMPHMLPTSTFCLVRSRTVWLQSRRILFIATMPRQVRQPQRTFGSGHLLRLKSSAMPQR